MRKNMGRACAVLCVAFILLNVVVFVIPTAKTATFWSAYVFTAIAFATQIGIWKFAFKGEESLKSKFLGIPLIHVGFQYLLVQVIVFAVFVTFPAIPSWIAITLCALVLGISAICLISAETGKEEIIRVEEKINKKVFFIKSLQVDVEMLAEGEADEKTKEALFQLAEKIRFSDPISHEVLADLESEIGRKISQLKEAENKSKLIAEVSKLLIERNKKAKILK